MRLLSRACLSLLLAAALPCAPAWAGAPKTPAHSPDSSIYLYHQRGVRVYTDAKPASNIAYIEIAKFGRPTATASCKGLTPAALQVRANNYDALINKYASQQGVQPGLVRAVMRVESCFDHRAVSRVGARGLMQLMPDTAHDLGVYDSFDAEQNISGGVRYLKMMLQRFNQDMNLAIAAYNAGPEAVAKHNGIPPFVETRNYVKRVLEAYHKNA